MLVSLQATAALRVQPPIEQSLASPTTRMGIMMRCAAGPCKYEMHDEQLGWEEIQAEYDALSEREKQKCAPTQQSI